MFSTYCTRRGNTALLNGISQYRMTNESGIPYGRMVTLITGKVDGMSVTWDEAGRYKFNQLVGDEVLHDLDLVSFDNEVVRDPGVYYMEFKKC